MLVDNMCHQLGLFFCQKFREERAPLCIWFRQQKTAKTRNVPFYDCLLGNANRLFWPFGRAFGGYLSRLGWIAHVPPQVGGSEEELSRSSRERIEGFVFSACREAALWP